MNHTEHAITFACGADTLVGIVSRPTGPASGLGVVIAVGGPQYRAGSHRQFVQLARRLASAGHVALRFDYRGMGDSTGALRDFQDADDDIAAAIDALQQHEPLARRVVLWGLCDAATAALLYWGRTQDARVQGMCLFNPWVRSATSLAQTQVKHYYTQRLRQPEFWRKLASGQVAFSALSGLVGNVRTALAGRRTGGAGEDGLSFQTRMARAWGRFQAPILLFLSGNDYTAKEFEQYCAGDAEWQAALARAPAIRHVEPGADHTMSQPEASASAEKRTLELLAQVAAAPAVPSTVAQVVRQ